jgi:hypothetical protein
MGGVKILSEAFEKDTECFKTYGKISKKKKWVRNIRPKNSEMHISTNIAQSAFWSGWNQLF